MIRITPEGLIAAKAAIQLYPNCFYEVDAPAGRRRFLLLSKTSLDVSRMYVDKESVIKHSADFIQCYVRGVEKTVIGSLLDVRERFCRYSGVSVSYMPPTEEANFACPTEASSGGLLVYLNGLGQFMAVSAKSAGNSLLVTDKGEV